MKKFTKEELKIFDKMFPMYKMVFEDTYRYRDIDVEYLIDAEPHELLRTGSSNILYIKKSINQKDWDEIYRLPNNLMLAQLKINRIKEIYDYQIESLNNKEYCMVEYENQMFKLTHWIPSQLHYVAEPIEPEKYYCEEGDIKVDLTEGYHFFYEHNTIVLRNNQAYINGELIISKCEFGKNGIPEYYKLEMMYDLEVINWVKEKYPSVTSFDSIGASGGIR